MTITTCVFDAYGTLFDVGSAARRLAEKPGHDRLAAVWAALAEDWRLKQLQYSWLRAVTGQHCPFWQVTQDGLDWALERHGLADDPALREDLLALYWELAAYREVPQMLATLKAMGKDCAILSNGSPDMMRPRRVIHTRQRKRIAAAMQAATNASHTVPCAQPATVTPKA